MNAQKTTDQSTFTLLRAKLEAVWFSLLLVTKNPENNRDSIHQLRISVRRAMAALKLYRTLLPKQRAKWMKKQFKRVIRVTNDLRDGDVFMKLFLKEFSCEVRQHQLQELQEERSLAKEPFLSFCKKLQEGRLLERKIERLLHQCEKQQKVVCVDRVLQMKLQSVMEKFFQNVPTKSSSLVELHHFRIRVKELKYMMEFFLGAFPPDVHVLLISKLKMLQQRLGKINDRAGFQRRLFRLLKIAAYDESLQLSKILAENKATLAQMQEEFFDLCTPSFLKDLQITFEGESQRGQ